MQIHKVASEQSRQAEKEANKFPRQSDKQWKQTGQEKL